MFLNNKVYDNLKWVAQYALPGFATLYFAISGIWGLPYTEEIVGTIVAINAFLGAVLGLSNLQFKKVQEAEAAVHALYAPPSYAPEDGNDPVQPPFNIPADTYELLKWIGLIVLPAGGTLYFALSGFWGFPYGSQVVGTVAAVTTFLSLMLGVSKTQYQKTFELQAE